ncbi:MAG: hypothetical protein AAGE01_12900 [Pseudomonadota bacterium]
MSLRNRTPALLLTLVFAHVAAETTHGRLAATDTKAYGVTMLRSHETDPRALVAFIEANWFAMDRIAVQRGVLTSYDMLARPRTEEDTWNVMVIVGYPTADGYPGITEDFEAIRSDHETVPIDGKASLADFGSFVSSNTFPAPEN